MATVLEILTDSLKKIGVTADEETLSSSEAKDGLNALNSLLASWNNDGLTVNGKQILEFPLVASQSSYTLGTGGDFNTPAPTVIDSVYLRYSDGSEYPIELIDNDAWGKLTTKNTTSTLPTHVYIDRVYPLRTVRVYPVPSSVTTLIIHAPRKFSAFTALTDTVQLFEGDRRALVYNLAIELAPDYGLSAVSQLVERTARESLAKIKRNNKDLGTLSVDPAISCSGGYDWRKGE